MCLKLSKNTKKSTEKSSFEEPCSLTINVINLTLGYALEHVACHDW